MTTISIPTTGDFFGSFDEVSISSGSIKFNGTSQYLQVGGVIGLSGNPFTVETWMYLTEYTASVDPTEGRDTSGIPGYISFGSQSSVVSNTPLILQFIITPTSQNPRGSVCQYVAGDVIDINVIWTMYAGTHEQYNTNPGDMGGTVTHFDSSTNTLTVKITRLSPRTGWTANQLYHTNNYYSMNLTSSASSAVLPKSPVFDTGINGFKLGLSGTSSSYTGVDLYANGSIIQSSGYTFDLNKWYHLAVTRSSGGIFTTYVNGNSIGSSTNGTSWTDSTPYNIGSGSDQYYTFYFGAGYLSNFRIVDGSSVYNKNFTPTGPLVSLTNTKLLLTSNPHSPFTNTSGTGASVSTVGGPTFSSIGPFYAPGNTSASTTGTISNPTFGINKNIVKSIDSNGVIMLSGNIDEVSGINSTVSNTIQQQTHTGDLVIPGTFSEV
jgi:hypothetical protein